MFRLLLRTSQRGFASLCNENGTLQAPVQQYLHLKSLSTNTKTSLSVADYLVTSLGVSPESALRVKCRIDPKSVPNANSVIALLKKYGFTATHITEIASKHSRLLRADPQKTLKPKLDFLVRSGISGDTLFHLVTNHATVLKLSLNSRIAPAINFLRTFFGSTQALISIFALRRGSWFLRYFSEALPHNLETLRRLGVPDENIVKFFPIGHSILSHDTDSFGANVKEIVEMGFDPQSPTFLRGVYALSSMTKDKRAAKVQVFRSFGWTEEQILKGFMKQPMIFTLSEDRLKRALEIFRKRIQWSAKELSSRPSVLTLSLEKRVLPRLAVLEVSMFKGAENWTGICRALEVTEDVFMKKFLMKHGEEVSQLLELYRKKVFCQ